METDFDIVEKRKRCEIASLIKYIKIARFFICTLSGWPFEELHEDVPRVLQTISNIYMYYLPVQEMFVIVTSVYYIWTTELDLISFGYNLIIVLLTCITMVRVLLPFFKEYKNIIGEFLVSFHLVHFKHKGSHFGKVYTFLEKLSYYLTIYNVITMLSATCMFNVPPFYSNYRNGAFSSEVPENISYEFSIHWSFPSFNQSEHFIAVSLFNFICEYNCAVVLTMTDLVILLMVIQIIGHIVLLRKTIESIKGPEEMKNMESNEEISQIIINAVKYSKNENAYVKGVINDIVQHHRIILSFTNRMSRFFGPFLAIHYSFHLVSLCILLLECTTGGLESLTRFGPMTLCVLGQLVQISITFEIVGTMSEKLPDALYSIPWESMDISNQRSMCILLHRLQSPIYVTAMGMTRVGVTTMARILKTTLSYFAFLRSINS